MRCVCLLVFVFVALLVVGFASSSWHCWSWGSLRWLVGWLVGKSSGVLLAVTHSTCCLPDRLTLSHHTHNHTRHTPLHFDREAFWRHNAQQPLNIVASGLHSMQSLALRSGAFTSLLFTRHLLLTALPSLSVCTVQAPADISHVTYSLNRPSLPALHSLSVC